MAWRDRMAGLGVWAVMISAPACAAESPAVVTSHTRASLVSDVDVVPSAFPVPPVAPSGAGRREKATLRVGLRLQLKPGWHTYWQNPGDAGEAPHVHVTVTGIWNGEGDQLDWPVPERVSEGGLMAYAYQGDVLLPLRIALHGGGADRDAGLVHVRAKADWLVCADVCVPESGQFELTLPGASSPGGRDGEAAEAPLFRRADAAMPRPSPFKARIAPDGMLWLEGDGLSRDAIRQGWFLPLEGGVIAQNVPQPLTVQPGLLGLRLKPDPYAHPPFWRNPLSGLVVLVDGEGNQSALQVTARPEEAAGMPGASVRPETGVVREASSGGKSAFRALWVTLLSAFLGGVILNLMPCVFPVLAMKLLSLAHMGGADWRRRWRSAVFYGVGVMGCFAGLGGVMMALRYGGLSVGWGFQFQSAGFVVGVGWLLLVMALNLLGVFQITGGRLAGRAGQAAAGHGLASDLLAGLLAVIVATPCTAPFMGVAIAAALAGPYWAGVLVFLAMGLGLAAPYVVLALMPGLASRLPRPGAWMERLKQFLAFPLLASCVWLLWVASLQRGGEAVLLMAGGAVLLGFAGWLYGLVQQQAMRDGPSWRVWSGYGLCGLCLLACLAGLGAMMMAGDAAVPLPAMGQAGRDPAPLVEPFSGERLAQLRAGRRPALVDMTAAWCVTCMVNEHVALDVPSVRQGLRRHGVTLLRGDWTRRDERITAFLKAHGRDGVPLYLYYPPGQEPRLLPQILTPGIVLEALAAAAPARP